MTSSSQLFHSLAFDDVEAGIAFLTAVGFTQRALHRDPDDASVVVHAEFAWRDNGGVMFGSNRGRTDNSSFTDEVGHARCYCVVETDADVDRVHSAALGAGATSLQAPMNPDYGGRTCTVRDPEGNQWSFGTYAGE